VTPFRPSILKVATTLLLSATATLCATQSPAQAPVPQPQSAQPLQQAQPTLPKPAPAFYRNIIVLDPAHGGPDTGAHLPNNVVEKDVTLSFSARLRAVLGAAGFIVLSTHETDPSAELSADQRAAIANHARPLACLILHATSSGTGVHLVTSPLEPADSNASHAVVRWQNAQAIAVQQSLTVANQLGVSIQNAKLPVILLRADVPPIDNLICPAVAIEIAPLAGSQNLPVTDQTYQQQVAQAIADALSNLRDQYAPAPGTGVQR
jgi:N-acetylmuramoyl-L-alanine amidase